MTALSVIGAVSDCDGAQIADIDGDGLLDVATCVSTVAPAVYWYEQGGVPWSGWTQHAVWAGGTKIEGIDTADYNGDGEHEIISLDQRDDVVRLHKPAVFGVPGGAWNTVNLLAGRPDLQDAQAIDIDGDGNPEIVYTFEGSGVGNGGVHWLDWTGGDVTNPANWTDHTMVTHEGAWWLASSGRRDLSGDGNATDIVFSARDHANPNAVPGIYWLEEPADVTNPWTLHTIDNTNADWLHCDVGDFSGNGHGNDVICFDHSVAVGPCWFDYSAGWARTVLALPDATALHWNMRRLLPQVGGRDKIMLVTDNGGGIYVYEYVGGAYTPCLIFDIDYDHPMDDRMIWAALTGDGVNDVVIPDSGGNRLVWLYFR